MVAYAIASIDVQDATGYEAYPELCSSTVVDIVCFDPNQAIAEHGAARADRRAWW